MSRVRRRALGTAGFTLVDTMATLGLTSILLGVALPSVDSTLIDLRANAGMRQMLTHMRSARDAAMTQRRTMEVQFQGSNRIETIRIDGVARVTLATTILEGGVQFMRFDGVPDTPDAFGNVRAVDFGGPTTVWFLADGSLVDEAGLPVSGTVFLGTAGRSRQSARAVTVLGPTGRVQNYRWDNSAWR
jgi:Tfp pilus assembly protein FimT